MMGAIWINVVEDKMQELYQENEALRKLLKQVVDDKRVTVHMSVELLTALVAAAGKPEIK
jgi:hypothetical protein